MSRADDVVEQTLVLVLHIRGTPWNAGAAKEGRAGMAKRCEACESRVSLRRNDRAGF